MLTVILTVILLRRRNEMGNQKKCSKLIKDVLLRSISVSYDFGRIIPPVYYRCFNTKNLNLKKILKV